MTADRPATEPRPTKKDYIEAAHRRILEATAMGMGQTAIRVELSTMWEMGKAEAAQGAAPREHRPIMRIRNRQSEERCLADGDFWPCKAVVEGWNRDMEVGAAPRAEGRTVVRIHHGDPDSHARSFNQGWDEALRDAIADIPEGNNDGWTRYDTDDTHVLSVYANGETWDVIAPKGEDR